MLWTDEWKFQTFGSKRRSFVRLQTRERVSDQFVVPAVKYGGSTVMVWGCFWWSAVGDLIKIDGILRHEGYLKMLQDNAMPSVERLCGQNFVFQEDNDRKHSSR